MKAKSLFSDQLVKINQANRILIIGSPGSGKTTFANQLNVLTGNPLYSMDEVYWANSWERPTTLEWLNKLEEIVNRDIWIIEGNYADYLSIRLKHADLIIFLEAHPLICLRRYFLRSIIRWSRGQNKLSRLSINFRFINKILTFNKLIKPKMLTLIAQYNVTLLRITN